MSAILKTVAGVTALGLGVVGGVGGNHLIQNYQLTSNEDAARMAEELPRGIRSVEPMACEYDPENPSGGGDNANDASYIYSELGSLTMRTRRDFEFGEGDLNIAPGTKREQLSYILGVMVNCEAADPVACDANPTLYNINEPLRAIHEVETPEEEFIPAEPEWFKVCNVYDEAFNEDSALHVPMEMFVYEDQTVSVTSGGRNLTCVETRVEQTADIHDDINDLFSVGPIAEYREKDSNNNVIELEVIMEIGDELQQFCDLEDLANPENDIELADTDFAPETTIVPSDETTVETTTVPTTETTIEPSE